MDFGSNFTLVSFRHKYLRLNNSPTEFGIVSIGKPDKSSTARYFDSVGIKEDHEDNAMLASNDINVRSLVGSMLDRMSLLQRSTDKRRGSKPSCATTPWVSS
jgi:hypothetical protein